MRMEQRGVVGATVAHRGSSRSRHARLLNLTYVFGASVVSCVKQMLDIKAEEDIRWHYTSGPTSSTETKELFLSTGAGHLTLQYHQKYTSSVAT